jgi:hypothetical protein
MHAAGYITLCTERFRHCRPRGHRCTSGAAGRTLTSLRRQARAQGQPPKKALAPPPKTRFPILSRQSLSDRNTKPITTTWDRSVTHLPRSPALCTGRPQGDNNYGDDRVLYNRGQDWLHRHHIMGRAVGCAQPGRAGFAGHEAPPRNPRVSSACSQSCLWSGSREPLLLRVRPAQRA